jgi:hypothetical protein
MEFPVGVVSPAPAVLLENADHAVQIIVRPRSPADGAEFADIDRNAIFVLKVENRLKDVLQLVFIVECATDSLY